MGVTGWDPALNDAVPKPMATRCPRCSTLFRVAPVQLEARAGKVRCGRCLCVFDATASLAVEGPAPDAAPTPLTAVRASVLAHASHHLPQVRSPAATGYAAAGSRRRAWVLASLALTVVLVLQLTYVWRGEFLARVPAAEPALAALCALAGCTLSPPQRPELVRIEASDLHTLEPGEPALIQLTATLRSYADHDVAYPALDLVLTNAYEHPLARRVFLPREYLGAGVGAKAAIAPRAEVTIAFTLDLGEVQASGFRLGLLAAPPP
jgi:predicted Zn finger-like uncharacterized protein